MNRAQALKKMVAPAGARKNKPYRGGVIQIHVTRACDRACFSCTQGSNLGGKVSFMPPDLYERAVLSLKGYWGVIGLFGGNPALSPHFDAYCEILKEHVPFEQRGIWCNNPAGKGKLMRETFDPRYSNINVHGHDHAKDGRGLPHECPTCQMALQAFHEFKRDWPECGPVGLRNDSHHSPPFVAMKDVLNRECTRCGGKKSLIAEGGMFTECWMCDGTGTEYDEEKAWELISGCDINQKWSASIGMFRGELRAWFCEIAMAQSILHQYEEDYPDTGLDPTVEYEHFTSPGQKVETAVGKWWQLGMPSFAHQVDKHCHECGIPLRITGEKSQEDDDVGVEHCSATHEAIHKPKRKDRRVEVVSDLIQLDTSKIKSVVDYLGNGRK